ncbi:MAG: DNA processing protein DprA [Nitrospira sp. ST-bin5]|nr:MAG: DNA processing protein DprA [Nitrospira sp. ST-bin5]
MGQSTLSFISPELPAKSISPLRELGAYESLWAQRGATFKSIADQFASIPDALPSDLVNETTAQDTATQVLSILARKGVKKFGVRIHGAGEYPLKLRHAMHPVELLYYRGIWELVETPCVAIVGTRKPSGGGIADARALTEFLVKGKWTIVSGLADGIDTVAHTTAIEQNGKTIAVIGTPICDVYPAANADLQEKIAREYLLVSQVPVKRYYMQDWKWNRLFFPERNVTMSALTEATVIVEAGNTSGTLIQARAALHQGRKLFILDRCFRNPELKWPWTYEQRGAIRVRDFSQITEILSSAKAE